MLFLVIDDDPDQARRLADWLQAAFPAATVKPDKVQGDRRVFKSWEDVHRFLDAFPEQEVTVCLDLSLIQRDYPDALRGLSEGRTIRERRPNWILIAFTQFENRVDAEPLYREYFDGMISKAAFDRQVTRERCLDFVKRTVEAIIRKHSGKGQDLPPGTRLLDSLGIRLFQAAFSNAALAEILRNEASGWSRVEVESLTSGHSGAFMLAIRGYSNGTHSLVLKVARSDEIIQAELEAQQKYLDQLGPLSGHLVQLDSEPRQLSGGAGVYYRQALIDGKPLLSLLLGSTWKKSRPFLGQVTSLCVQVCQSVNLSSASVLPVVTRFPLGDIDIHRLDASTRFLEELGHTLRGEGFWPTDADPTEVCGQVREMANTWSERAWASIRLPAVVQHGDFNPGNVVITQTGPVLIDLQRLGPWPVGYDLSRLALMLRLRLLDVAGHRDWLPDRLRAWVQEQVAGIDFDLSPDEALCKEAVYCDQQFRRFLRQLPKWSALLAYGYKLASLWDLVKVISYRDLSPFKKLYALIECWRLKKELEAESLAGPSALVAEDRDRNQQ